MGLTARSLKELRHDLEFRNTTYRDLGKKYGVHEVTIRRYNVLFGFGRRPIDHKGIILDLARGLPKTVIADKYEVDVRTVHNIKKRHLRELV